MDGVLNICKPRGTASFSVVSLIKRKLGLKKVGHLGTLDPAACGVLVLMCGKATKLANQLHAPQKVYRTLLVWQKETDTLDDEGQVVAESAVLPTEAQIRAVLPSMVGDLEIQVPKFSAVHINGQRAYDLARKGVDFVPPKKIVHITRFELLPTAQCWADLAAIGETAVPQEKCHYFEIECTTGTYIRSLAKLLAEKLGTVATASVIIRTRVGQFDLADAQCLNDVTINDIKMVEELQ